MGSFPEVVNPTAAFLEDLWPDIVREDLLRIGKHIESHLGFDAGGRSVSFAIRSETYREVANTAALAFWLGAREPRILRSIHYPDENARVVESVRPFRVAHDFMLGLLNRGKGDHV